MSQSINLGPQENNLLLTLAERGDTVFDFETANCILRTSNSSTRHVLMNLTRKGRLQRIQRGKYLLVPETAGRDLCWAESPWVIVPHLIDRYYVGFLTAMDYWGMTDQIPYTIFVATTKRKNSLKFGNQKFEFVTLSASKFFGFIEQKVDKRKTFVISSKEKTVVDGLMHPVYCGGIPEMAKAIWNARDEVDWSAVLEMSRKTRVDVVLRRLGYLLNILEIKDEITNKLKNTFKGYHFLDPNGTKERFGYSKKYGLIINRNEDHLLNWREY